MKRQYIVIILWFCIIIGVGYLFYCTFDESVMEKYTVDQLMMDLENKGYEIRTEQMGKDFLDASRIRLHLYGEILDVYSFTSARAMEAESRLIHDDGCGYTKDNESIEVSWASYPHFYKKGKIIVQYIGKNLWIEKLLEDILGDQFVGYYGKEAI